MIPSKRNRAAVCNMDGNSLHANQPLHLGRTVSNYVDNTSSPKQAPVSVIDLNGSAIRPNQPFPVLRRTTSGHLFQAEPASVYKAELRRPRPVAPTSCLPAVQVKHTCPSLILETKEFANNQLHTQIAMRPTPARQAEVEHGWGFEDRASLGALAQSCAALVETTSQEIFTSRHDSVICPKTETVEGPTSSDVWMEIARDYVCAKFQYNYSN
ncbi:hypothetical protein BKA66DRAFT_439230 [Pyrenochaeta sp. MPI-SDFR-AT-0127]|nr:hypothetical protein BKA66DRAFT_439230 [Pyrenochaeta sp. MPI-SDFR-AT-0127]